MEWWSMMGFGCAVLPICLTPGVSFTLVTQRVHAGGVPSGLAVVAGTCCGLLCHATLAGLGVSALVMRSAEAFSAIKLAGALYLIVLGLRTLWVARTRRTVSPEPIGRAGAALPWNGHGDLAQGFLGNVLNPKAAAVYLTVAPQFLHADSPMLPQMLQLCLAHMTVAAGWLLVWTAVVRLSHRTFSSLSFRRMMDRVSGGVLVALGVRTAVVR
jgi:threonine/homoserine/homoserine lactone efflux protein